MTDSTVSANYADSKHVCYPALAQRIPMDPSMRFLFIVSLFACLTNLPLAAQVESDANQFGSTTTSSTSSDKYLDCSGCNVQLIKDVELPALESGQIKELRVKPGDTVNPGEVLVVLDDELARLAREESQKRLQIANERAMDETEINTARKRYQLAFTEHQKSEKLSRSGSVSPHEANRAKYSMEVSELEYHAAVKQRDLARTEAAVEQVRLNAAVASVQRHQIKSPIDGSVSVVEIVREAGEWVTAGDPIMRLALMERLRVPAIIQGELYDQHEIANRPVTVTLTRARGRQVEFTGKIVYAEIERKPGNIYRVWAEVENRLVEESTKHWMLQPGCVVNMRIHLEDPPLQSASVEGDPQIIQN